MSDHGVLVPLRRAPARRAGPLALLARRAQRDPRATAVVAAAVALGAERGLRQLTTRTASRTTRLPIRPRPPAPVADGRISVEWVAYAVRLTGRAPLR